MEHWAKISSYQTFLLIHKIKNNAASVYFKGTTKLCFTHYMCVVIILFNTGLYKSAISTYSFAKLLFLCLLWFSILYFEFLCHLNKTYDINISHCLKVQSCKLYNNKNMIALTQITNTEIFAFKNVQIFKLLSHKTLFINRKDYRNC